LEEHVTFIFRVNKKGKQETRKKKVVALAFDGLYNVISQKTELSITILKMVIFLLVTKDFMQSI
jgi:hypothetical protein